MFHIVTPFPMLLNYSFYAPLILRLALALFVINMGFSRKRIDEVAVTEIKSPNYFVKTLLVIAGLFVFVGFYLQVACIIVVLLFGLALFKKDWVVTTEIGRAELILLISIAVTLMFLGAGAYAIDYPL